MTNYTLIAYVEDKPGVLTRVASLFRRRAFNIASLTVGPTEQPGVSRMTIVVDTDELGIRRAEANLYKLVNVIRVDVAAGDFVARDLALIKVAVTAQTRPEVLQLAEVFRAHVVDVNADALILEVTGPEAKVDKLVDILRPYGIIEMGRTGRVAMMRGAQAISFNPPQVAAVPEDEPADELAMSV